MPQQPAWRITATTINCDAVNDEVTILVHKDWSVTCTGYAKYVTAANGAKLLSKKSREVGHKLACEGPLCERMKSYCTKLQSEEPAVSK